MINKITFGQFLRQKRIEKGLTQKELSEKLFLSESAISKWEKGKSYPDITMIPDICAVLEVWRGWEKLRNRVDVPPINTADKEPAAGINAEQHEDRLLIAVQSSSSPKSARSSSNHASVSAQLWAAYSSYVSKSPIMYRILVSL